MSGTEWFGVLAMVSSGAYFAWLMGAVWFVRRLFRALTGTGGTHHG